ncbi:MAG: hypothetical protein RIM80_16900, partial [Alphaproteobacteria bacterium]
MNDANEPLQTVIALWSAWGWIFVVAALLLALATLAGFGVERRARRRDERKLIRRIAELEAAQTRIETEVSLAKDGM